MKKVVVVDIGGTHVKLMRSAATQRKFDSGPQLPPQQLIAQIKEQTADWQVDAFSIGFPAPLRDGRVLKEPNHLRAGWVGWKFERSLGKPTA